MDIEIINVMGIERAVLPLDTGIKLVVGLNAAGKSSLLECIAAAATEDSALRNRAKKDTAAMLREGSAAGSITLRGDKGQTRIVYPSGEVKTTGVPPMGTRLGLGAQPLVYMLPAKRMQELQERFKIEPTKQDISAWLAGEGNPISDDALDKLVARLAVSGWDKVWDDAKESATRLKGQWQAITNVRWGSKIADGWIPDILVPGADYVLETEREKLAALRTKEGEAREAIGVDRGRVESLRQTAGLVDALRMSQSTIQTNIDTLNGKIRDNLAERGKHIDAADAHSALKCPHCAKILRLEPATAEAPRGKLVALPMLTGEAIKEARDVVVKLDEDRAILTADREELAASLRKVAGELAAAETAAETLAGLENAPSGGADAQAAYDAAAREVDVQQRVVAAVEQMAAATAAQEKIARTLVMATMLSSDDGVRKTVWGAKLEIINQRLFDISEACGFEPVGLTADADVTYADRAWNLLSESERWRCQFVISVLLWEEEGTGLPLLVDRLDVLHPQARGRPMAMLHTRKIPAVVAMTARDQKSVPDMERAGYGSQWWIAAGVLTQFHHTQND